MRQIVVDWGTSRFRAVLVEDERVLERTETEMGIGAVPQGGHRAVFLDQCSRWLVREPDLPVMLVGMAGSREGWEQAPYVTCPAGAADIAAALTEIPIGDGRVAKIVPGLVQEVDGIDVMRGEETLALGAGVDDGVVCLPGTHPKWVTMREGRIQGFATFLTGELYGLLRHHSMVGRPATDPVDPEGFALGLAAARENRTGLLNALFAARAATLTGHLRPSALGPYLSGLLTGEEIEGAIALHPTVRHVTLVAGEERGALYRQALGSRDIATTLVDPEPALLRGVARILRAIS
jgi:2-dehydro-3-deoxygalactonokinase